ncbi:MAG: hypothetical protein H6Q15_2275 [Bacteroidetes bacterium]|nr:hypothetical protein [Bacteroidota bacterium]
MLPILQGTFILNIEIILITEKQELITMIWTPYIHIHTLIKKKINTTLLSAKGNNILKQ